jgi:hypothetical protein
MADLFEFPAVEIDRREMVMFQTPAPRHRTVEDAAERARSFGVEGEPEDHGTAVVVRDRAAAFELFTPSDSLRFTRWPGLDGEPNGKLSIGDPEAAIERARDVIDQHGLGGGDAQVSSIAHVQLARTDGPGREPETQPVAVQVNLGFELDGLPVLGPGAKVQVTLGADSSLLECFRFWREPRETRTLAIIGLEEATRRLRDDPAYRELPNGRSRVVFDDVRLGYLGLPPRELQGYLFPVYAFRGTVSTPELERYDHTRYVIAVDIPPEQIKRLRVAHRVARAVI